MANPKAERPMELPQLWRRSELNAPEFCFIIQRLAAVYPSQSASDRANGFIKLTSGSALRNNCSIGSRVKIAKVADK